MPFLPVTAQEAGGSLDFIIVSADAYVDHPSFGHAIVSRIIEAEGFSVGIIPQPQTDEDYKRFGAPNVAFLVSGGVVDSMVNNYTVAKIRRTTDVYSEGGEYGKRPDRAVTVYTKALKRLFPSVPVAIGGIEASLRRFAHYDYWSDSVMPSILLSSGADLLMYGMGERPLWDLLALVKKGVPFKNIKDVRGTAYLTKFSDLSDKNKEAFKTKAKFCPSYEEVASDKVKYAKAFKMQSEESDYVTGETLIQKHGDLYVVQNPPQKPLSTEEMDRIYDLPFMRAYHPMYKKGVPAIKEVKFSIASVRGCFGECSYCALTYHQGRRVQNRSKESILREAKLLTADPEFKGYIHDVGGPTADFYGDACDKQQKCGVCKNKHCIGYEPCKNLKVHHEEYLDILRSLRALPKVKKVFVRSGVRFDFIMYDQDKTFFRELVEHHVSGQLKVAPEHCSEKVLSYMNKPSFGVYQRFKKEYEAINKSIGKEQYLVPYFISSHPGSTVNDAIDLAVYLHSIHSVPEQVQDFYPTPSTKSTCMYYTGLNPDDLKPVYVPKSREEKREQRALLQYGKPENYDLVHAALVKAGRTDLIGNGPAALIRPRSSALARSNRPAFDKKKKSVNKLYPGVKKRK
ncbi:MAG TPA: YgiQ family radical SAM protein [Clostridiales bacterium]|nr:YgiQ family radical SAM protein [Clostridiales bacterium]